MEVAEDQEDSPGLAAVRAPTLHTVGGVVTWLLLCGQRAPGIQVLPLNTW